MKKYIFLLVLIGQFFGCSPDEETKPSLTSFNSENTTNASGVPGTMLKIEGQGLNNLEKIILDNKFSIPFNPNLNSSVAIFFQIPPFDINDPYRFGVQPIKFIFKNGEVIESQINIIQPLPVISSSDPQYAKVSEVVILIGDWFYDITSITFDGQEIFNYEVQTLKKLSFIVPSTFSGTSAEVIVTTAGGVSNVFDLPFSPKFVLVSDFDGNGARLDWGDAYGDMATWGQNFTAGGISGNYAQMTWTGAIGNGYNGYSSGVGPNSDNFLNETDTNPAKAFLEFDYYTDVVNTNIAIQVNTIDNINWGRNFKSTSPGWQFISIPLTEFSKNYGYDPIVVGTHIPPHKIKELKFGFAQGDTPNPSLLRLDNIKIKYILE